LGANIFWNLFIFIGTISEDDSGLRFAMVEGSIKPSASRFLFD
jgi:hypothetical protein